ncbi:MAG: 1-deoxy-D-xylulose-5-phosphate reductoisomerase, partial [Nevskiales bacterium]
MDGLVVLGATGTIGLNTLDVAARYPERFRIVALSAHRDVERLAELCLRHRPAYAVMGDLDSAAALSAKLQTGRIATRVLHGSEGLAEVVSLAEVNRVMAGIVGAAGLLPTLAAVRAGKQVLLANKEPLVMAGRLFMRELARGSATLLPVDSEHNAIFQCLPTGYRCGTAPAGVRKIILTASGGPFRELPLSALAEVTPEQAVRHPNWVMGPKISVDSATMMNKGLELI